MDGIIPGRRLGDSDKAVADAKKAIELDPSMSKAYLRTAVLISRVCCFYIQHCVHEARGISDGGGSLRNGCLIEECDQRIVEETSDLQNQVSEEAPTSVFSEVDIGNSSQTKIQNSDDGFNYDQVDGKTIAPTSYKDWGKGLLWWMDFTKLVGITIQGKGVIDGRGSVWWQDYPYDDLFDDESKLIVLLYNTKTQTNSGFELEIVWQIGSELDGKMPSIKPTVRTTT
ncbi:hypothetical protein Dsin_026974 [Dipteronia sinensis]|uniref:Uncharacterized protein n=1 Tax=Dipteronia sinensis TaxID=43782 RepID=A0AAE0DZR4_9ROSI|nr:hypothetical protein Dsin_026974 [Dipteronia sinensis]